MHGPVAHSHIDVQRTSAVRLFRGCDRRCIVGLRSRVRPGRRSRCVPFLNRRYMTHAGLSLWWVMAM